MEVIMTNEMEKVGLKNDYDHDHDHDNTYDHQMDDQAVREDEGKKNGGKRYEQKTTLRTPADIYEHPTFYAFILDMPGLDAHNIKVKVENGILHVSGKKKKKQIIGEPSSETIEGVKVIRIERRRARYMRKFTLAEDANTEQVKAAYKDGVLSITVPKANLPALQLQHSNSNSLTNNVSIT